MAESYTITNTEALAKITLLINKMDKKNEFILRFLTRQEQYKDPLEKSVAGGSPVAIQSELQAVNDLQEELVKLRLAIAESNAITLITVAGITQTVARWLIWKREVYPKAQYLYDKMSQTISSARGILSQASVKKLIRNVRSFEGLERNINPEDDRDTGGIVVNIDEKQLQERIEKLSETYDTLDGALSLKNATTFITIEM